MQHITLHCVTNIIYSSNENNNCRLSRCDYGQY